MPVIAAIEGRAHVHSDYALLASVIVAADSATFQDVAHFAHIGLNEREARAQRKRYRLFKVPMEANLRARALAETRGFIKALVNADSDRILGFTALY